MSGAEEVRVLLDPRPVLAGLALPLLIALHDALGRRPLVCAEPALHPLLAAAGGHRLRLAAAAPRPADDAVVIDLHPGSRRGGHPPLRTPDGPRSEPYWRQCFQAAEEAGLGSLSPPPAPFRADSRHAADDTMMLIFEDGNGWRREEARMFARTAVEAGRRSVVDASSAGGPGPALLSSLRRVGVVVTDRPAVLAWSVAVGTPCVGVLDLGAAPIFHRPAWGPATLVAAMDGDGAGVSHREVAAAVDDLTVQLHHPSSRLVLITESPAEGS